MKNAIKLIITHFYFIKYLTFFYLTMKKFINLYHICDKKIKVKNQIEQS